MTGATIPSVPAVDQQLLDAHREARRAARDALDGLTDPLASVARWYLRGRLVESMANVFVDDRPLLVPPRRRHLGPSIEARVRASEVGFRHLDARLEMLRRGHIDQVVGRETPYVLNAFAESHGDGREETNPGLIRLTSSGFDATQSAFVPPDGALCGDLLEACVDVANDESIDAVIRAGWCTAAVLAIHPFVDGNGRTARMLYQLIASSDDELRTDWGSIEQWSVARSTYVAALKASQAPSVPRYDGDLLEPSLFVDFAVRASTIGSALVSERIAWMRSTWDGLGGAESEHDRVVQLAVDAAGSASLDELAVLVDEPLCTDVVRSLVERRRLRWDQRGLLRVPSSV